MGHSFPGLTKKARPFDDYIFSNPHSILLKIIFGGLFRERPLGSWIVYLYIRSEVPTCSWCEYVA